MDLVLSLQALSTGTIGTSTEPVSGSGGCSTNSNTCSSSSGGGCQIGTGTALF